MGEASSGDVPNMDIGNSPRMTFTIGLGEAEVADAIYLNKLNTALKCQVCKSSSAYRLGANPFVELGI